MLDLVFAVAFLGIPVAAIVITRSAALVAVLLAAGIGGSGVLMQFTAITTSPFTLRQLQVWLLVTLVAILVAAVLLRRAPGPRLTRSSLLLVGGSSVVLAVAFIASRMLAPGSPGPLSGVGYLIQRTGAEDNAKWLNTAAQMALGTPVDVRAAVGGPLVLVMVVAATLIAVASTLLYGGVNQVAVAADTLILGEFMLVVLAPFALAPLVQVRRRWFRDGPRSTLPWPFLLLGIVVLGAGLSLLLALGHFTLQYTILVLALWVSTFLSGYRTAGAWLLTTVAVIAAAEVWFPLNVLAAALLAALAVFGIRGLVRRRGSRRPYVASLVTAVVLLVLMFDFLRSSILYALGVDGQQAGSPAAMGGAVGRGVAAVTVTTLPLFSSPGGTEQVTLILAAIAALSVIGSVIVLRRDGHGLRVAAPFAPIAVLVGYALLVTLADFWAIGSGPNYASKKLTYAVVLPILAATLPVALMVLDRPGARMTLLRWTGVGIAVALLVLDTFLPRALVQLKPALWPTATGDPAPYWWPAEVKATGDQALDRNPIGCVYLPQGAAKPSVLQDGPKAYSCTRILTGLTGLDVAAAGLTQWALDEWLQNTSNWDHYHAYLSQMSPEVRARSLIILDDEDRVIGLESLQSLLDRYPPDPDVPQ